MSESIGKKIGMTSTFGKNGRNALYAIIEAGPCVVTQVRTKEVDGYDALQLDFDDKVEKCATRAELGHFGKAGSSIKKKVVKFQGLEDNYKLGGMITVDFSAEGGFVDVSGTSKGKGFQGVVRRHGFGGIRQTAHSRHSRLRAPGSAGASSYPLRMFRGTRMADKMGVEKVTV